MSLENQNHLNSLADSIIPFIGFIVFLTLWMTHFCEVSVDKNTNIIFLQCSNILYIDQVLYMPLQRKCIKHAFQLENRLHVEQIYLHKKYFGA